jgi:hypothetical protein
MGVMDKLKFWKKEEVPEFPKPADFAMQEQQMPGGMEQMGVPRSIPGINEPPMEGQTSSPFAQPPQTFPQAFQQQQQFAGTTEQQLQLISSKLDTIKAQLETVLQRLERLEKKEDLSSYQQRWRTSI